MIYVENVIIVKSLIKSRNMKKEFLKELHGYLERINYLQEESLKQLFDINNNYL